MFGNYRPDEQQPRSRELSLTRPLIVLACAGGGIMLSFGLCGANAMFQSHFPRTALATTGLILFVLSVLSFVGATLWLLAAAIINAMRSN